LMILERVRCKPMHRAYSKPLFGRVIHASG
jgi:hypothetical protein